MTMIIILLVIILMIAIKTVVIPIIIIIRDATIDRRNLESQKESPGLVVSFRMSFFNFETNFSQSYNYRNIPIDMN